MKIILSWCCFSLILTDVLLYELKNCLDINDKVLIAEHQSSVKIGCNFKYLIKSCSISKRDSPSIRCSNSECHPSDKIRFTGDTSKSICEFELQNVVSQGKSSCNQSLI
jgi:hypothetical protein